MIRYLALGLALALTACSGGGTDTGGGSDKGGESGGGKSGGGKSGGGGGGGGSSSSQSYSCCINGSHYDCPSESAVNKCFDKGDPSGCKLVKRTDSCSGGGGGGGDNDDTEVEDN